MKVNARTIRVRIGVRSSPCTTNKSQSISHNVKDLGNPRSTNTGEKQKRLEKKRTEHLVKGVAHKLAGHGFPLLGRRYPKRMVSGRRLTPEHSPGTRSSRGKERRQNTKRELFENTDN